MARWRLLMAGDGRHAMVQQWSMPKPDIRKLLFLSNLEEYGHRFGMEKLEWYDHLTVKIFENNYVYSCRQNTRTWRTDRRVDTARRHRPRLRIASRGKNRPPPYRLVFIIQRQIFVMVLLHWITASFRKHVYPCKWCNMLNVSLAIYAHENTWPLIDLHRLPVAARTEFKMRSL